MGAKERIIDSVTSLSLDSENRTWDKKIPEGPRMSGGQERSRHLVHGVP